MRPLLSLASIALAACATAPQVANPDGFVGLSEIAVAGPLTVRPLDIAEDSRCPINARCVWAGRVIVRTLVDNGGERREMMLTLGEGKAVHGGRLMLDSVVPEQHTGGEIDPAAYRFHFSFTR